MEIERIVTGASDCHARVAGAIRRGILPHPVRDSLPCADCGGAAVEYDHRDYNHPLVVEPVCRSCNLRRGRAIPRRWESMEELKKRLRNISRIYIAPWAREYCMSHLLRAVGDVERLTDGKVTREELRPDIFGPAQEAKAA